VPRFTEARIQKLCADALAVTNEYDIERVMTQLRSALEEHVRLAHESLDPHATSLSLFDSSKNGQNLDKFKTSH
jgi:hypothetical protein